MRILKAKELSIHKYIERKLNRDSKTIYFSEVVRGQ